MRAGRIAGIAIYFVVGAFNRSARGNGNGKVIILACHIAATFVEISRYGFIFVQSNVTLVFFIFKGQTTSPAGKSGAFFRDGFEVSQTATPASFGILANFFVILAAITAAVYSPVFFPRILSAGIDANNLANTFAGFSNRNSDCFLVSFAFFVESGGNRFVAGHFNRART